ncbi:MAG: hypothetical protein ACK5QS_13170 [Pseudanabaenaceae cyanobacterium]|jgi:hypothetical protein
MFDQELADQLALLYRKQAGDATTIDFHDNPGPGLKGLVDLSAQIMHRVTKTFSSVRQDAGSWVADESLLLQLLTQRPLTVDLTVKELQKECPFGIAIRSLCDLARHGFIYLNVRDFESEAAEGFPQYAVGRTAKNLRHIIQSVPGSIYFGGALRKPLFDASIRWSGRDGTYEQFYEEAIEYLTHSAEAYEIEVQQNPLGLGLDSLFRGERQSLTAAAWHWAFLNSVKTKIPNIFDNLEGRTGLISRFGTADYLGDKWSKNRTSENQASAATAFLDLAGDLRTAHQNFTAPITASWGGTYNMTSDEFEKSRSFAVQRLPASVVGTQENWQRLIFIALAKSQEWNIPAIQSVARGAPAAQLLNPGNIDSAIVDKLIERMRNDSSSLKEAKEIRNTLKQAYLQGRDLTEKEFVRLTQEYNRISQINIENYIKGFEGTFNTIVGTAKVFDCWGMPTLLKVVEKLPQVGIKMQDVVEKILLPNPEDRILYQIIRVFRR